MKKHIFVLYTGGTIGMTPGADGLRPDAALLADALPSFSDGLSFDCRICEPLIDSSAVSLQNWRDWLALLAENIPRYDGVLLLHGTDTLAYTAALLALALRGLDKPVVLTGAQRPFGAAGSDAPRNLATAAAALKTGLPQVCIAFNGKLFPAIGSNKCSTESDDGFANPHFGVLGTWSEERRRLTLNRPSESPSAAANAFSDGLEVLNIDPQAEVGQRPNLPADRPQSGPRREDTDLPHPPEGV